MKLSKNNRRFSKGYTLIEIAAVIAVLLALIGVLLVGIQGYIAGVNRTNCILKLSNLQKAARSYAAMHQVSIGKWIMWNDLLDMVGGSHNSFRCPGSNIFYIGSIAVVNYLPDYNPSGKSRVTYPGIPMFACSLSLPPPPVGRGGGTDPGARHYPQSYAGW